MSVNTLRGPIPGEASALRRTLNRAREDPAYQAFALLRIGFTVLPIVMGIDKFSNTLVNWEQYLAPWIHDLSPLSAVHTMHVVGVIEIAAGIAVAIKPRYAAYIVAAWLGGIVVNLLSYSGYYDIALRDFGLMLAALTLARLAAKFDPPGLSFLHRRRGPALTRRHPRSEGACQHVTGPPPRRHALQQERFARSCRPPASDLGRLRYRPGARTAVLLLVTPGAWRGRREVR